MNYEEKPTVVYKYLTRSILPGEEVRWWKRGTHRLKKYGTTETITP